MNRHRSRNQLRPIQVSILLLGPRHDNRPRGARNTRSAPPFVLQPIRDSLIAMVIASKHARASRARPDRMILGLRHSPVMVLNVARVSARVLHLASTHPSLGPYPTSRLLNPDPTDPPAATAP